ncbi:MAG: hypothetical protein ACHQX3_05950 [Nitrospirales bacterium]
MNKKKLGKLYGMGKKRRKKIVIRKKKIRKSIKSLERQIQRESARILDFQLRIVEAENQVIQRDRTIAQLRASKIPMWKTGVGEILRVTDMEEQHLRNAISFCARRLIGRLSSTVYVDELTTYIEGLANLMTEAKRRGFRV